MQLVVVIQTYAAVPVHMEAEGVHAAPGNGIDARRP